MRVLQINSVYGYGSTGKIVRNLHHAIQEKGHESFVIYGRGESAIDTNVYKIGNFIEQGLELVSTRLFNKHGYGNQISTSNIIRKIKEIKPDIVHLHNIHGYYINFSMLISFLKESKIQVVWLLHDTWLISGSSAEKGGIEYDWEGTSDVSALKSIANEYPKHSKISSRQSINNYYNKKRMLENSGFIFVTPSIWLKEIVKNSYLGKNEVLTIYNGIDIDKFNLFEIPKEKSKNILGVANIWEPRKGLKYFNQLANDLDDSYSISIVGKLPKESSKLNPRIKHISRTNSVLELAEEYSKANVFVNPTLYDNFPTVNLEAQACGTPVITFDTGGSGESIVEGTGNVVRAGNYKDLLTSIKNYPPKSKSIENKCRENAEKYSTQCMLEQYLLVYKKLL